MSFDPKVGNRLLVKMEPVFPHGDHRKPAAKHHRRQHRGTTRSDHRNVEDRAQRGNAGITHRIDTDGGKPLLLRRLAHLEDADIGKHHIGLAYIVPWRRPG